MSNRPTPALPAEAFERNGPAAADQDSPRRAASDAVRGLIDVLVSREVPDEVLVEGAAVLGEVARRFEEAATPGKRVRQSPDLTGHPQDYFASSPMNGINNPMSLPLHLWGAVDEHGDPVIRGRAIFSLAFEGPPTCVHGGIVALCFDEILGNANLIAGRPGMTGTLTIRYRRPTPLMTTLELEAKQIGVDGRKIKTVGTIKVDGEVTAEAEAIFIEVLPEQMLGIVSSNADRAGSVVVDPELQRLVAERDATSGSA